MAFSKDSVDESSLYIRGRLSHVKKITITIATDTINAITNIQDVWNPIASYNNPLTDGPIKAPSANVDVHKPDIKPYVSIPSPKPCRLKLC